MRESDWTSFDLNESNWEFGFANLKKKGQKDSGEGQVKDSFFWHLIENSQLNDLLSFCQDDLMEIGAVPSSKKKKTLFPSN